LHYRGDVAFKQDRSRLRLGHAAKMMAAWNNLVIELIAPCGFSILPDARFDSVIALKTHWGPFSVATETLLKRLPA
jgi:hypothetical protein